MHIWSILNSVETLYIETFVMKKVDEMENKNQ